MEGRREGGRKRKEEEEKEEKEERCTGQKDRDEGMREGGGDGMGEKESEARRGWRVILERGIIVLPLHCYSFSTYKLVCII